MGVPEVLITPGGLRGHKQSNICAPLVVPDGLLCHNIQKTGCCNETLYRSSPRTPSFVIVGDHLGTVVDYILITAQPATLKRRPMSTKRR